MIILKSIILLILAIAVCLPGQAVASVELLYFQTLPGDDSKTLLRPIAATPVPTGATITPTLLPTATLTQVPTETLLPLDGSGINFPAASPVGTETINRLLDENPSDIASAVDIQPGIQSGRTSVLLLIIIGLWLLLMIFLFLYIRRISKY